MMSVKRLQGGIEFRSIATKVKLKGKMRKNITNISKCEESTFNTTPYNPRQRKRFSRVTVVGGRLIIF
jgi:hypothetical protein